MYLRISILGWLIFALGFISGRKCRLRRFGWTIPHSGDYGALGLRDTALAACQRDGLVSTAVLGASGRGSGDARSDCAGFGPAAVDRATASAVADMSCCAAIITSMKKLLPLLFCFLLVRQPARRRTSQSSARSRWRSRTMRLLSPTRARNRKSSRSWVWVRKRPGTRSPTARSRWTSAPASGLRCGRLRASLGRLGASAASIKDQVFLFGGYVVDSQGGETTLPDVNVFVPYENRWYRAEDTPVPVDDFVLGVYRDRYIYLIGGWSKTEPTRNVQVYDTEKNKWMQGHPDSGDTGVWSCRRDRGRHDRLRRWRRTRIRTALLRNTPPRVSAGWARSPRRTSPRSSGRSCPTHPGNARYRIAAGGSDKEGQSLFLGRNRQSLQLQRNGLQRPAVGALPGNLCLSTSVAGKWEVINENTPDPAMDHRGLLVTSRGLVIVGGMNKGQQVTANVASCKSHSREVT